MSLISPEGISDNNQEVKEGKGSGWEKLLFENRFPVILALVGTVLLGFGVFVAKNGLFGSSDKIEILGDATEGVDEPLDIVVEVSGAVEKPGVYKFKSGERINDAIIAAGGVSADADRTWMEKVLNRAAFLIDGQKIYIPSVNEQLNSASANFLGGGESVSSSQGSGLGNLININSASQKELESLTGIGPVYAQSIIEHRPYSTVEELKSKGAIKEFVFEKIRDKISVY